MIVTLPVKVPGGRTDGSTVTAMVVGADPETELIVSQLSAEARLMLAEAVKGKDARFVNTDSRMLLFVRLPACTLKTRGFGVAESSGAVPSWVMVLVWPPAETTLVLEAVAVLGSTMNPMVSGPLLDALVVMVRKLALLETVQGQPTGAVMPSTPPAAAGESSSEGGLKE